MKTPPMMFPMAQQMGAPAAKVANAIERRCEGGKECARMPSAAGMAAAAPTPCSPRRTLIVVSSSEAVVSTYIGLGVWRRKLTLCEAAAEREDAHPRAA